MLYFRGIAAVVFVSMLAAGSTAQAADAGWVESYPAALAESKKTGKPILANFTGSDWCGWCQRLKAEVFTQPEFVKWAQDNVILLELDYPSQKAQTLAVKEQNQKLKVQYGIQGYPTILFLNAEGESVGRSGYREGGAGPWIKQAQGLVDAAKPPQVKWSESWEAAVKQAQESKKPLLYAAMSDSKLEKLFEDTKLIELANRRTVAVASSDAGNGPRTLGIAAGEGLYLIDLQAEGGAKVLWKGAENVAPAQAINELEANLPKIAYDGSWIEDFKAASGIAAQDKRPILLDFTGSDWCGWCIKLDNEVFSKQEFKDFAAEKLVLVKLDFPQRKPQDAAIQQQNQELAQKYGIRGLPTILVLSPEGKTLGQLGYMPGGPAAFLGQLKKMIGG